MSEFAMPEVHPGDIVLHAAGPHSVEWSELFVTDVFNDNISGVLMNALLRPGPSNIRENVVHQSDPRTSDPHFVHRMAEEGDQGIFVLHPTRLRMEGRIARLERRLESLEGNQPKGKKSEQSAA